MLKQKIIISCLLNIKMQSIQKSRTKLLPANSAFENFKTDLNLFINQDLHFDDNKTNFEVQEYLSAELFYSDDRIHGLNT